MIKFESYLQINDNNNKNNTASYNRKLDSSSMPTLIWLYSSDLKKGHWIGLVFALFVI